MEDFHKMIRKMQSGDWAEQFESLNIARTLMKHSVDVFKCVNVHEIVFQVLMLADSLRSSLSKNALMALADMCQFLNRCVEPDLDTVSSLILRKAVDTNVFISEAANKALIAMCQYCSEGKVVNAVLNNLSGARSSLVKAKSAYCFEVIFQRLLTKVAKLREFDRVLKKLSEFSTEASPEVRGCAKSALRTLANSFQGSGELDKLLFRCLNTEEYKQVKTFMTQTVTVRSTRGVRFRTQTSLMDPSLTKVVGRRSSQSPTTVDSEVLEQLQLAQGQMQENNWQIRTEAVLQVMNLIIGSKALRHSSKLLLGMDLIAKGLMDRNINVTFKSLDALKTLITSDIKSSLFPHCSGIVHALASTLSSGNSSVRGSARQVLSRLIQEWDAGVVVGPLVSSISKATERTKGYIAEELVSVVEKLKENNVGLITKIVLPGAKLLLNESKPELKLQTDRLMKCLYDILGNELVTSLNQEQLPRLLEVLETSGG